MRVTSYIFQHLYDKNKSARHSRKCDYRHLLLLLPFILSNLIREEVQALNSRHRGHNPLIDPFEELIGVANVFLNWYMLFRRKTPGKTPADITNFRSLSHRYIATIQIIAILSFINFIVIIVIIVIILVGCWIFSEQCFLTAISWAS